jgi:hypothetical protein
VRRTSDDGGWLVGDPYTIEVVDVVNEGEVVADVAVEG